MSARANAATDIKPGSYWRGPYAPRVRVLVTVEGYVVHRIPGCVVCLTHHREWRRNYVPLDALQRGHHVSEARTMSRAPADEGPADWHLPDMPAPK